MAAGAAVANSLATPTPPWARRYFEGWLSAPYRNTTTGKLDTAAATHALLRMINVSKEHPDKGITFKAGPGPCVGYVV